MRQIKSVLLGCLLMAAVLFARKIPWSFGVALTAHLEYVLLFFSAVVAGVRLPDIDLVLPGLQHRSGITHSCLPVLVPAYFDQPAIAAGLAISIALHLASDLQPRAWSGGALIRLPLLGSLGQLSPLWILVNMIGCLHLLFNNLTPLILVGRHWLVVAAVAPVVVWYFVHMEKKRFLPIVSLAFCTLLIAELKGQRLKVDVVIQYFAE